MMKKLIILTMVLAAMQSSLFAKQPEKRPNIFMLFADDATVWDFGCYGNKVVKTPRIDQLAKEGLLFDNMFTPTPMCCPSRTVLYTGLYPVRNGCHPNHGEVKPDIKSMAHYMSALGYRVVLLGKLHIRPVANFPFEYYQDGYPSGGCSLKPGPDAVRILSNPGDKPLCMIMCKSEAHYPWPQNNHGYDPNKVDLPPYLVDTPITRQYRANYYSKITDMDNCLGSVLDLLKKTNQEQNTLFLWAPDHGTMWPHERQNVYDGALKLPFIARWPGKIKPGTKTDALCSLADILPTFIEAAGGNVDELVTNCDGQDFDGKSLLPILLGQKSEHHQAVYGFVSYGVMEAYPMRSIRTQKFQYIWNIDSHFQYPSFWTLSGLPHFESRNKMWKSWEEKAKTDKFAAERIRAEKYRPPEELYDIQQDPYELKNLADDPSYQDVLATLRQELKTWMKQQGDNGDNSYHAETNPAEPFLDTMYCRQKIVNIKVGMNWNNIEGKVNVKLTSPVWVAKIHYTLDGSEPTKDSPLYTKPFTVKPRVTIKAKGFWDGDETPTQELKYWGPGPKYLYEQTHLKPILWP